MTCPTERIAKPGWENKTPRSPDDFAQAWKRSAHRRRLLAEVDDYLARHPLRGDNYKHFAESRRRDQSEAQRPKSPFTLSYVEQIGLTLSRSWLMLKADPSVLVTMLLCNLAESLIVSSLFYDMPEETGAFFKRGFLIYFVMMMNTFNNVLEILTLYAKRPIVEKHARYALYHPSAEALSSIVVDVPYKIFNAVMINAIFYIMGNLKRDAGAFFFFLLVSFSVSMSISMAFRVIASLTRTMAQALARASILLLAIALYTGFAVTPQYMPVWIGWIRWLNPTFYAQESLMINEFGGRTFPCSGFVPQGEGYEDVAGGLRACAVQGSVPGRDYVEGSAYLESTYGYKNSHKWPYFLVVVAFGLLFMGLHLVATEYVTSERSKGEVLVFTRKALKRLSQRARRDEETGNVGRSGIGSQVQDSDQVANVEKQSSVFHWRNVCYDVAIKGEDCRILDHVDGWVKPGTLTALMVRAG